MLILSRKLDEKIVLPTLKVTITVLEIRGTQVRVGIEAPDEVPIHRQEVWLRIQELEGDGSEGTSGTPQ
jgi:carbon storage regulator